MPNLNLLQGKNFQKEVLPEETETVSFREFEPAAQAEPAEETVKAPAEAPESIATEQIEYSSFAERRSSWPIVAAVVGVILIGVVLYWAYRGSKGHPGEKVASAPDTTKVTEAAPQPGEQQPAETTPTEQPAGTQTPAQAPAAPKTPEQPVKTEPSAPAPAPVSVVAAPEKGRQQAAVAVSLVGDLLKALPSGAVLSFLSFDGETFMAEIGAPDASVFAAFQRNLRAIQPGFSVKTVFEREEEVGDRVYTFRQVQGKVPVISKQLSASNTLAAGRIRAQIARIAAKHGLALRQLSVSPAVQSGGHTFRPATIKLSGSETAAKGFISELLSTYANIGVDRLLITRITPTASTQASVNVVLDVDIYEE